MPRGRKPKNAPVMYKLRTTTGEVDVQLGKRYMVETTDGFSFEGTVIRWDATLKDVVFEVAPDATWDDGHYDVIGVEQLDA